MSSSGKLNWDSFPSLRMPDNPTTEDNACFAGSTHSHMAPLYHSKKEDFGHSEIRHKRTGRWNKKKNNGTIEDKFLLCISGRVFFPEREKGGEGGGMGKDTIWVLVFRIFNDIFLPGVIFGNDDDDDELMDSKV